MTKLFLPSQVNYWYVDYHGESVDEKTTVLGKTAKLRDLKVYTDYTVKVRACTKDKGTLLCGEDWAYARIQTPVGSKSSRYAIVFLQLNGMALFNWGLHSMHVIMDILFVS